MNIVADRLQVGACGKVILTKRDLSVLDEPSSELEAAVKRTDEPATIFHYGRLIVLLPNFKDFAPCSVLAHMNILVHHQEDYVDHYNQYLGWITGGVNNRFPQYKFF